MKRHLGNVVGILAIETHDDGEIIQVMFRDLKLLGDQVLIRQASLNQETL